MTVSTGEMENPVVIQPLRLNFPAVWCWRPEDSWRDVALESVWEAWRSFFKYSWRNATATSKGRRKFASSMSGLPPQGAPGWGMGMGLPASVIRSWKSNWFQIQSNWWSGLAITIVWSTFREANWEWKWVGEGKGKEGRKKRFALGNRCKGLTRLKSLGNQAGWWPKKSWWCPQFFPSSRASGYWMRPTQAMKTDLFSSILRWKTGIWPKSWCKILTR